VARLSDPLHNYYELSIYLHNTYTCTNLHKYIHTYILTFIQIHIYIHSYLVHTYIHTYIHSYVVHTYTYTYIRRYTYIRTHTCVHTHIHTHIHTYIHLNKQTLNLYQNTRRHIPEDINFHSICTNYCPLGNKSDDRTVHWKAYRVKLLVLSSGSHADSILT
jgi:hypothetical protein